MSESPHLSLEDDDDDDNFHDTDENNNRPDSPEIVMIFPSSMPEEFDEFLDQRQKDKKENEKQKRLEEEVNKRAEALIQEEIIKEQVESRINQARFERQSNKPSITVPYYPQQQSPQYYPPPSQQYD